MRTEHKTYIELDRDRGTNQPYLYVYEYKTDKRTFYRGKKNIRAKLKRIKKSGRLVENGFPWAMWSGSKSFNRVLLEIGITKVYISLHFHSYPDPHKF